VRDQVFFYFSNGDAPRTDDTAAMATVLTWSPFLLAAAAAAVAIPFAILAFPGAGALRAAYSSQPPWLPWLLMIAPAALVAAGFLRLMGPWRRGGLGTIASVARSNVPIWLVLGGTAANLGLGSLTGWGAHGIVIMHVVTWYVFILAQFARRGAATKPSHWTWRWLRDTPTGFKTLHVGSVAVLVAAGAVWAYGFRNTPDLTAFRLLLDGDLFRYWTIMHVTVSFGSR